MPQFITYIEQEYGEPRMLVTYDYVPAGGDDWNEPSYPASVTITEVINDEVREFTGCRACELHLLSDEEVERLEAKAWEDVEDARIEHEILLHESQEDAREARLGDRWDGLS